MFVGHVDGGAAIRAVFVFCGCARRGFGLVSVAVGVSPAKLTFFRGAGVTVGFSSGRLSVDGGGASLTGVKPTSILALLCFVAA